MGLFIDRSIDTEGPRPRSTAGRVPMARVADAILAGYMAEGCSIGYRGRVQAVLSLLVRGAGVRWADQLDGDAVIRFDSIVAARGTRHRANFLSALHAICTRAVALGLIGDMPPFPDFPNPCRLPAAARDVVRLTADDVNRTLDRQRAAAQTWEGHREFVLIALLATVEILRREALTLRLDDIDLARGIIRIRRREALARSKFPGSVPIPPSLSPVLAGWLPRTGCEWVFPGVGRVGPWTDGARGHRAVDRIRSAGRDAGVAGMTFDALRRFAEEDGPGSLRLDPPPGGASPEPRTTRRFASRKPLAVDEAIVLMIGLRDGSAPWEGHRLFAASAMPLLQGVRRGELLRLQVADVNLDRGLLAVRGRSNPVVLIPDVVEILGGWLRRPDRGDSPYVFPGSRLMGPWFGGSKRSKLASHLAAAGEAAGVSGRVTVDRLWRTWRAVGRIDLGEAWRAGTVPAPELTGPHPGRPGPPPIHPREAGTHRADRDNRPDLAMWDPGTVPGTFVSTIRLGGPGEPTYIDGQPVKPLTKSQHAIVSVLLAAGTAGLSVGQIRDKSAVGGGETTLRRLKQCSPLWDAIIVFPGRPYGCYRIAAIQLPDSV